MSLRDRLRANQTFEVDDAVRKVLARWSKEQGTRAGLANLEQGVRRLTLKQRRQLADRLAEISLGMLFIIEQTELRTAHQAEAEADPAFEADDVSEP